MTIYSDLQTLIDTRMTKDFGGHTDTEFCAKITDMSITPTELCNLVGELLIRVYALENP